MIPADPSPSPLVRPRHELARRIAVAAVLLPPIAWVLWQGGLWTALLLGTAAAIATWEYYRLTLAAFSFPEWTGVAAAAVLATLPLVVPRSSAQAALALIALFSMSVWISHVLCGPRPTAPARIGHLVAGLLFSGLGLWSLAELRAGGDGLFWAGSVLVGCWANDSTALLVGKTLGRHKMLPAVSPAKTWEGFGGGFLGGLGALGILNATLSKSLTFDRLLALAVLIGVLGPLGDLSKSLLKRAYHVKDSGRLFPGHGGMLDRIDSLLFSAPAVLAFRLLFEP
jgi:phosphatidate cytidylyltransferase